MKRLMALLALVLALGLAAPPVQAGTGTGGVVHTPGTKNPKDGVHRDPPMMTNGEYAHVQEGQTRYNIQLACSCTGVKGPNPLVETWHGNEYRSFQFLAGSGHKYVMFRVGLDGKDHAGMFKAKCPDDPPDWNMPSHAYCEPWDYFG